MAEEVEELVGVVVPDGDTFAYQCGMDVIDRPIDPNSPVRHCAWYSRGWDEEASARARGLAHEVEHREHEAMSEIADSPEFRKQNEARQLAALKADQEAKAAAEQAAAEETAPTEEEG